MSANTNLGKFSNTNKDILDKVNNIVIGDTLMKKRLVWVDIAKGIAIILMIIGHEISGNIRTFIFSFHMPLFFILSGFTSGVILTLSKWRQKLPKILKIYFLAIFMVVLLSLEKLLVWDVSIYQVGIETLKGIFWGSNTYSTHAISTVGVMWFLIVFVWAKILFELLQVLFDYKYIGVILGIISYFAYLVSLRRWLPQDLDIVPIAALFMWVGSILKQGYMRRKTNIGKYILPFLIFTCFVYWIACLQNSINIEMATRHYPYFLVSLLEALAGTVVISYLSMGIVGYKISNCIAIIGQHTLAILCIHQLDFYKIFWSGFINSPWLAALTRLIVDLVILIVIILLQHSYKNRFSSSIE